VVRAVHRKRAIFSLCARAQKRASCSACVGRRQGQVVRPKQSRISSRTPLLLSRLIGCRYRRGRERRKEGGARQHLLTRRACWMARGRQRRAWLAIPSRPRPWVCVGLCTGPLQNQNPPPPPPVRRAREISRADASRGITGCQDGDEIGERVAWRYELFVELKKVWSSFPSIYCFFYSGGDGHARRGAEQQPVGAGVERFFSGRPTSRARPRVPLTAAVGPSKQCRASDSSSSRQGKHNPVPTPNENDFYHYCAPRQICSGVSKNKNLHSSLLLFVVHCISNMLEAGGKQWMHGLQGRLGGSYSIGNWSAKRPKCLVMFSSKGAAGGNKKKYPPSFCVVLIRKPLERGIQ
jgi:hypothetical protein